MGLWDKLVGNAMEIAPAEAMKDLAPMLGASEQVALAYKLTRDMIVLTNVRLLLIDKQGLTGSKSMITAIPYSKITKYARETAGWMDADGELYVWVTGTAEPIKRTFSRGVDMNKLFNYLGAYVR